MLLYVALVARPREPKPSAVVTSRTEGSNGLAHDYLYPPDQCKPKEL